MALDKEFYEAKAGGDPAKFAEVKNKCLSAGYEITAGNHLTATGRVKDAPPAPTKEVAAAKFGGDAKGIRPSKKGDA